DPPDDSEAGLNDTDTPLGAPDADNDTDSALPDVTPVLTVADAEPPAVTDPDAGDTAIEKSLEAGAVTVNEYDTECEPDAAEPVTVIGYVPAAVDDDVDTDIT